MTKIAQTHKGDASNFISNKHIKWYWWTSNRQLCAIAIDYYNLCASVRSHIRPFRLRHRHYTCNSYDPFHSEPLKLITSSSLLSRAMVIGSKQEFLWLNLNLQTRRCAEMKYRRWMNERACVCAMEMDRNRQKEDLIFFFGSDLLCLWVWMRLYLISIVECVNHHQPSHFGIRLMRIYEQKFLPL